jgi:hypothetical protein
MVKVSRTGKGSGWVTHYHGGTIGMRGGWVRRDVCRFQCRILQYAVGYSGHPKRSRTILLTGSVHNLLLQIESQTNTTRHQDAPSRRSSLVRVDPARALAGMMSNITRVGSS